MPPIKTRVHITFLGTQQHRDTHHSALVSAHHQINELAKIPDSPVAAWLLDGPGCVGTKEHPMPGTYFYRDGIKIPDANLAMIKENEFREGLTQAYHALTGLGVESSIFEAVNFIEDIIVQNEGVIPDELTVQGFSRGADNCVRLANVIYLLYPEIKMNLFLVDPVPGPGRRDDPESYYMPPNVQHCHVILMLDEHRNFYDPQHSERYMFTNPQSRVAFHYMPGRHGAGLSTRPQASITPAVTQTLVQDDLLRFNIEHQLLPQNAMNQYWHTSIAGGHNQANRLDIPRPLLTDIERFEHLCIAMQMHKRLAMRTEITCYHNRRIYTDRSRYVLDADLFLDAEHRAVFKKVFPATFNWFFEKNHLLLGRRAPIDKEEVLAELQQLKRPPFVDFYTNFIAKFNIPAVNKISDIPEPQGVLRIEKTNFNMPLVTDELSYLQFSLRMISSEYHYRVPTTWLGNWLPGFDKTITKNWQSDSLQRELKKILDQSLELPPREAKLLLKKFILKVKSQPKPDFFFQQVSKIIPDSTRYIQSVRDILQRYESLLPPDYATLLNTTDRLIRKQVDSPLLDDYQKRLKVQEYLTALSTAIHRLNIQFASKNYFCEQLVDDINVLSRPSYAESTLLDRMIADLDSYYARYRFFSYFPFSKMLGFYNPNNIVLVKQLLEKLYELKQSTAAPSDLNQIQAILIQASMAYAKKYKQEEGSAQYVFWKKHVAFKADPLNQLIETHLTKVTQLSQLIFSIPNIPLESLDEDDLEHRDRKLPGS